MAQLPKLVADDSTRVIFRAADPELDQLCQLLFSRYPKREWASFIRCGIRSSGDSLLLTLAHVDPPKSNDLDPSASHVVIREPYTLRTALTAETHPFVVGVVHSHPQGYAPLPSALDDDMDSYYGDFFGGFTHGRPFVSLIVSWINDEIAISGRVFRDGRWLAITKTVLQGKPSTTWIAARKSPPQPSPRSRTARLSSAFGVEAEARLHRASAAVIGAGGTGSAAIEVLARAGIGKLIIVDPDYLEDSNLERVHGSRPAHADARIAKATLARQHVEMISPECEVIALEGRLPQREIVDAIVEADVVLGCTDSEHSRLALGDVSARFLLSAIDCAALLEGREGSVTAQVAQLTRFLPADACPLCRGMVVQKRLNQELMSPEERQTRKAAALAAQDRGEPADPYWIDEPQLNTVGYHTTAIGALAAGYAIGWVTGRFSPPFTRLQMNLVAPLLDVVDLSADVEPARPDCNCRKARGWADQGERFALISAPLHWAPPRLC